MIDTNCPKCESTDINFTHGQKGGMWDMSWEDTYQCNDCDHSWHPADTWGAQCDHAYERVRDREMSA